MIKKSKDMANLFLAAKILGKGGGSPTPPEPPADGKTRLYISLAEGRLSPVLGMGVNGSVDIDWGDGTEHGTLTGSNTATLVTIPHTYAQSGDYIITLTAAEGTEIAVLGTSGANPGSLLITKDGTSTNESRIYRTCLKKAHLEGNVTIRTSAFYYCYGLTSVTISDGITSIESSAFNGCVSLLKITISENVTIISSYAFMGCNSLASVTIPKNATTIGENAFINCYGLGFIKFASETPPTVTNINAWSGIPTDCIIYVPQGTLAAYTSATNYPDPAVYTYVEY